MRRTATNVATNFRITITYVSYALWVKQKPLVSAFETFRVFALSDELGVEFHDLGIELMIFLTETTLGYQA